MSPSDPLPSPAARSAADSAAASEQETADAVVSQAIAAEAGQLLLDLRDSFGPVDPEDRARAGRLRDEADAASHRLIVSRFAEQRPGDIVLSEEGVDDPARLGAERVWIVDPLDGTWEYGSGRADFAVHIVLWTRSGPDGAGTLSASTVELPAQGATLASVDPRRPAPELPTDRPLRLVASRSRAPKTLSATADRLGERLDREVEIVGVGSVGAKVAEILRGNAEAYVHDTGFYEWDVAAPLAVVHRYGYHGTHTDGADIRFNRPSPYVTSLVVAHPAIATDLLQVVALS